jgi:hypothetical protein
VPCFALFASTEDATHDPEIPIAPAATLLIIPRGFFPWRLSDAGPAFAARLTHARHPKLFTKTAVT